MTTQTIDYGTAIREGFEYLLAHHPETFIIGQGVWSPWYVGNSMTKLEQQFGKDRVIDSPVSEAACTGLAVGASLCGYRPIVIHPRLDFMILAVDSIVNQAAKWSHMLGGQAHPSVTIRGIINRGGEQGAQHSQALHSWFAHIPGLRVVMPATVQDARDLLIASVLCDDPVLYIDDRWLYERQATLPPVEEAQLKLSEMGPQVLIPGSDITFISCGYSTYLCEQAAHKLENLGINAEVIDLRVLNPLKRELLITSVQKTGRLMVVDGGWRNCGMAAEVISSVLEELPLSFLKAPPMRITLPDAPAPTSKVLEEIYYPTLDEIVGKAVALFSNQSLRKAG
jgi:acetoin:2,6-dichlorophenolindophenol oxidoreductase subunit beta